MLTFGAANGQERKPETAAESTSQPDPRGDALDIIQTPFPAPEEGVHPQEPLAGEDLCDADYSHPEKQEDTQEFFYSISCHTFRWFDGLFGHEVDYPEDEVNGLVTVGGEWTEYESFDSRFRFKVRAPLPNWDKRWNLILDRGDEDAFISDTETQNRTFYNPGLINRNDEDSLLLGLGHRGYEPGRSGWDWSVGARLRSKPVGYVRGRWYYYKHFNEGTDLRFRQTFFYRTDDGFGLTTRADFATEVGVQDVLRWEVVGTSSDATEGTEWFLGQTWYHLLRDKRAFSVLAFAQGETNAEVEFQEAGLNFIWRQTFTRDYIWLSYGPSITWPRYFREEKRETSLGFGVWLEMEFGNWVY